MRGRKPDPLAIKKAKGVRASRLNEDEPKYGEFDNAPPSSFAGDDVAIAEWHRVVDLLTEQGVIQASDVSALEVYCGTYSLWRRCHIYIVKHGRTTKSKVGGRRLNPEVTLLLRLVKVIKDFSAEFGLTPSSRGRIRSGSGKKKDEDEDFFGD